MKNLRCAQFIYFYTSCSINSLWLYLQALSADTDVIANALRKSDAGLVEVQTLDVSIFLFLGQPLMANSQHPFFSLKNKLKCYQLPVLLWWTANAWNQWQNFLRWPININNSVNKIKLSFNTSTNATPQFL